MARLRFLPSASRDILGLWVSIAGDNPRAADRIIERIEAACGHLRDHPYLGPARPEIGEGARALIIGRWIAFYKVDDQGVQVVRVVDGACDLERLSFKPE